MIRSIRWRLVASYVLLVLLTVGVMGALAVIIVRRAAHAQEIDGLHATAQALARQAKPLMWPTLQPRELSELARTAAFMGDLRVRFLDTQERVLVDSGQPETGEILWIAPPTGTKFFPGEITDLPVLMPRIYIKGEGEMELVVVDSLPPGTSLRLLRRSVGPWGNRVSIESVDRVKGIQSVTSGSEARSKAMVRAPIGDTLAPLGFVELSGGLNLSAQALGTIQRAFVFAGIGAIFLAVLLGLYMSQRLTSPLRKLRDATARMGAGEWSVRAPVHSRDEIGELAAQFNQMVGDLEHSFSQLQAERDALRRFIADASHELRTPITALKNFVALLQGPAASDSQAQAEFLAESKAQVGRLEWITQNLLDLSRLDAGLLDLEIGEHDLGEIVRAVASGFAPLAAEKGIDLTVETPAERLTLRCDRSRLEMAIANLLENAVKFTPAGGSIHAGASGIGGRLQAWVQDSGRGIGDNDLPHIFERFYRGGDRTVQGSGLGLAIAKSLVEAQGGRIGVTSESGKGARFEVDFETGL